MGSGGWAALIGFAVIAFAFLSGKRSGKKQQEHKVAEQKQKVKKVETEKTLIQESAKEVQQMTAEKAAVYGFFNDFERELSEAKKDDNMDYAIEAAKKLAQRATAWRDRNK